MQKIIDLKKRAITAIAGISLLFVYKFIRMGFPVYDDIFVGLLFLVLYSEMLIACYISSARLYKRVGVFAFTWIYLIVGLASLSFIFSIDLIMKFLAAVFFVDTSAYLVGNLFKGPKLCPNISPKKTVSGFVGASVIGTIMFELMLASEICIGFSIPISLIVGFIFSLIVQLGDLFVSFLKRVLIIKDFSNLLPGHGGFWDRFDSIFAGAIFFVILNFVKIWANIGAFN